MHFDHSNPNNSFQFLLAFLLLVLELPLRMFYVKLILIIADDPVILLLCLFLPHFHLRR